jgi:DNA-binding IclR family transcriptional regulator
MKLNRTLLNAQAVIDALAAHDAMSPAELALQTPVARSSVYRLIEGLMAVGLVETLPDSRVQLTHRWLHLADAVVPAMREWDGSSAILESLAAETSQTAYLSVLRGDHAVCINWAQGRGIDLLILKPGHTLPLYAGGAGHNLLAHTPALIDRVLGTPELPAFTPHTLVDADALRADIATTLRTGYTLSHEDVTVGIGAIGTAVTQDGQYLGCLSVAGLIGEIKADQDRLIARLRAAADELGRPTGLAETIAAASSGA